MEVSGAGHDARGKEDDAEPDEVATVREAAVAKDGPGDVLINDEGRTADGLYK